MTSSSITSHCFDLRGMKAGNSFMGCKRCWWHSDGAVAMVNQCPNCGARNLLMFTVNEDDVQSIGEAQK
jgi:hypothetical protein